MDEISILSPATVSNVVCGFDCLGFALETPCDEMTVRKIAEREIRIINRDSFGLPDNPLRNVAGVALQAFIDAAGLDHGFAIESTKHIKPGSGIGSSAASACGAVVAANQLTGAGLTPAQLVDIAMAGEVIASGTRHADNLAPCIFGGFTLVRSTQPLDIVKISSPELFATVIHPLIEIKTSEARAMLPQTVDLSAAVRNWSNLGAFVAALNTSDHELMSRSMVDEIVEPVRSRFIPRFAEVKAASLESGALGGGISGSGPSIFMLSTSKRTADDVAEAMRLIYETVGVEFNIYVSAVGSKGVRIV